MNLTKTALKNPAGVSVGVAILVVFGIFSLTKLPVQLFPDIEQPQIGIWTGWRAASPREVESEILEPQEEVLEGIPGLTALEANANRGGSWVNLTFGLETDMQETVIEVISRLNRLPPLPRDADPPALQLGGGGGGSNQALSWFFIQLLPGNNRSIESYGRVVEDVVKTRIESVPGVAGVEIMAGSPEELQIVFDPFSAADLGIEIPQLAAIARSGNDVSMWGDVSTRCVSPVDTSPSSWRSWFWNGEMAVRSDWVTWPTSPCARVSATASTSRTTTPPWLCESIERTEPMFWRH
jgi:multidrug efflux pump subunit AcrB